MRALRASELVPAGFAVENAEIGAERVIVVIRGSASSRPCPLCKTVPCPQPLLSQAG
jgi:hypothetical protein